MDCTTVAGPWRVLNVAFDVSSEWLNWTYIAEGESVSGECENRTDAIRGQLVQIRQAAERADCSELRVICESTGVYHRSLLRIASQLGLRTNLVSGEAVSQYRRVQFGDNSKTDAKDPAAMLTVAQVGRLIKHRQLDGHYAQLRELHRLVIRLEDRRRLAKNELHAELRTYFPDLRLSKEVMFGPTGRALFTAFNANPERMIEAGREELARRIKPLSPQTKRATLDRIWQAAKSSSWQQLDAGVRQILEEAVRDLYAEITVYSQKIEQLEQRMQQLYAELQQTNPRLPSARKGVISGRLLAALVAEVGPPEDFSSWRQLMRYAGLNLTEQQSGQWRGQTVISRRGRSEIRYVLNKIAWPLVRRGQLFGDYYWKKREVDRMPGNKAMTAVMRKVLKMFYGWSHSQAEFDRQRVFAMHVPLKVVA